MFHPVRTAQVRCLSRYHFKTRHEAAFRIASSRSNSFRLAHGWSDLSPRSLASLEDSIIQNVGTNVFDPVLQKDLSSLKWLDRRIVVSNGKATIALRLPTPLHPSMAELKANVKKSAQKGLETWLSQNSYQLEAEFEVEVVTTNPLKERPKDAEDTLGPGLARVSQFLAVYSCKGGVGKSTVAVNLAYELARMGGRIGLLDVDIYGPSLPILLKPDDPAVRPSPLGAGMVYPITQRGVKVLSLGYVSPKSGVPGSGPQSGSAIMRGPMVGRVVTQLLKGTDWGDLDVLILDLPPGTGDVQLTVCQELQLDGAVAVTTPSLLAIEDTKKGMHMFSSLGVPTFALVENMSYFVCEGGGKHYPFGKGQEGPLGHYAIVHDNNVRLPISALANSANDQGLPLTLSRPHNAEEELRAFQSLAEIVSRELLIARYQSPESFVCIDGVNWALASLTCTIESGNNAFVVRFYSETGATQVRIPAFHIRRRDPKSGDIISSELDDANVSPKTRPTRVEKKGKYGLTVEWADGATLIYSLEVIAKAAQEVQQKQAA